MNNRKINPPVYLSAAADGQASLREVLRAGRLTIFLAQRLECGHNSPRDAKEILGKGFDYSRSKGLA